MFIIISCDLLITGLVEIIIITITIRQSGYYFAMAIVKVMVIIFNWGTFIFIATIVIKVIDFKATSEEYQEPYHMVSISEFLTIIIIEAVMRASHFIIIIFTIIIILNFN